MVLLNVLRYPKFGNKTLKICYWHNREFFEVMRFNKIFREENKTRDKQGYWNNQSYTKDISYNYSNREWTKLASLINYTKIQWE